MRTTPGRFGGRGGRSCPPRGRGAAAETSLSARRTPPGCRSPRSSPPGRDSPRRNSTRFCTARTPLGRWRRPRRVLARRRRPPPPRGWTAGEGVHLRARARGCPRRSALPVRTRARVPQSPPRARRGSGCLLDGRAGVTSASRARATRPRSHAVANIASIASVATPTRDVACARPIASTPRRAGGSPRRRGRASPRGVQEEERFVGHGVSYPERQMAHIRNSVIQVEGMGRRTRTAAADWPTRVLPESKIAPSSDRLAQGCCLRTIPFKRGAKSAGRVTHAPPKTRVPRRRIHLGRHSPHSNAARASKVRHRPTVARFPALSHRATFSVHSEGAGKGVRRSPRGADVSRRGSCPRRSRAAGNRAWRRGPRCASRARDRGSRPIPPRARQLSGPPRLSRGWLSRNNNARGGGSPRRRARVARHRVALSPRLFHPSARLLTSDRVSSPSPLAPSLGRRSHGVDHARRVRVGH